QGAITCGHRISLRWVVRHRKWLADLQQVEGFAQRGKRGAERLKTGRGADSSAGGPRVRRELVEQTGLSDSGFAPELCDGALAVNGSAVEALQRLELRASAD
ncbi:MAG: hypothetical protein WBV40_10100, partial [Candidatus Cybelea sp.]